MNKITLPEIPQEALTPEMLELLAVLERLADTVHRAQEKIQGLEAEIARRRTGSARSVTVSKPIVMPHIAPADRTPRSRG